MPSFLPASPLRLRACIGLVAAGVLTLSGCSFLSTGPNFSWTYKIDIQQGVVVTQEMVAQLRPGMTQDQVRFVLGTPAITDPFHAKRWDYPYRFQPARGPIEERKFTVYFDNDRMTRYEGDPQPTEKEFVASRLRLAKPTGQSAVVAPATPAGAADASGSPSSPATQKPGGATPANPTPDSSGSTSPSFWDKIKGWFGGSSDDAPKT